MMTKTDQNMLKDFYWNELSPREQGYIIGMFLGDGSMFTDEKRRIYRIRFFLTRGEPAIQRLMYLLRKIFRIHKVRLYSDNKNEDIIEIHSKTFVQKLRELTRGKTLKSLNLTNKFLIGILEGLIDSDGHVWRKSGEIKSANTKLVQQISLILKRLGISYKLKSAYSHWSCKPIWKFYFHIPKFVSPVKLPSGRPI
jgi:DNA-binding transcriptional regulator WhiA